MTICRLFEHFDSKSRVHIAVNEIRDKILEYKPNGVIQFEFVNIDPTVCPAKIIIVDAAGDTGIDGSYKATVFISKNLGPKWQRLAATKELLHVLDEDHLRASSEIEVDHILEPGRKRIEWNQSLVIHFLCSTARGTTRCGLTPLARSMSGAGFATQAT